MMISLLAPEGQVVNITIKSCITEDDQKCIINFNVCEYYIYLIFITIQMISIKSNTGLQTNTPDPVWLH